MGLRPARTIRNPKRVPWTRWSKSVMSKSYIKAMPHKDLVHFMQGTWNADYNTAFHLIALNDFYHRDNAIEAARQALVRQLEKNIPGKFMLKIRAYPHNVVRENKMHAGAGADRIQQGMRLSFGKPTDRSARVREGKPIFSVYSYDKSKEIIDSAMKRAARKLSGKWRMEMSSDVNR